MLTALSFTNVSGAAISFLINVYGGNGCTVDLLDPAPPFTGSEIPKMESSGQWGNHEYQRSLVIHQEGKIVGSTAATYLQQRAALMGALMVNSGAQAFANHGTISATWASGTVTTAGAVIVDLAAPMGPANGSAGPTVSPYMVTFRCDNAYWQVSGADYKF